MKKPRTNIWEKEITPFLGESHGLPSLGGVFGGLLGGPKYQVFCKTENKVVIVVTGLEKARIFGYKHAVRNHDVVLIDGKGNEVKLNSTKWVYRCDRCGMTFDDDAAWVTHRSKGDCQALGKNETTVGQVTGS